MPVEDPASLEALAPGIPSQAWAPSKPAEFFTGNKPPVEWSEDLRRILALPRREPPVPGTPEAKALVAYMTPRLLRHNVACVCRSQFNRACVTSLLEVQAWALYEIALMQGLLGAVGVGQGKTFIDLLAPMTMPHCKLAVLLCPPRLVKQLVGDYKLLGQHFWLPHLTCHGAVNFATDARTPFVPPGAPTLHVYPFSLLSQPTSSVWLERMKPDAIFVDEAHLLKDRMSARTIRVLRYFVENSSTRFACWTGSLTDSKLEDYAHLSALALRHGSPVPLEPVTVKEWGRAIDASAEDWRASEGALAHLKQPGDKDVRDGFRRRFQQTAGVVHTIKAPVDARLEIRERKVEVPADVLRVLAAVRATSVRPDYLSYGGNPHENGEDGEELVDQFALNRCLHELASGFFYRWRFPRQEPIPLIQDWKAKRKRWNKEVREQIKLRLPHMDSPMLCAQAAARAHGDLIVTEINEYGKTKTVQVEHDPSLPHWPAQHWAAWRDIRDAVQPKTEAIRFNDFLARDAARWALENRGIVWYHKREFGQWVAEFSGLPRYGGGPNGGGLTDDDGRIVERGDRSLILSLQAHGTGVNGLQFLFDNALIANPMSSAQGWEQVIGRLHRIGTPYSVIYNWLYKHTPELSKFMTKAMMRAQYITGTIGGEQKLTEGMLEDLFKDDVDLADDDGAED